MNSLQKQNEPNIVLRWNRRTSKHEKTWNWTKWTTRTPL